MTETKNAVIANDVATKVNLIKNKKTKAEKMSVPMNVIVDDEINSSKFKKRRSDRRHLRNMNTLNKYKKKIYKLKIY